MTDKLWNVPISFNAVVLAKTAEEAKRIVWEDFDHVRRVELARGMEDPEEITSAYDLPLNWADEQPCFRPPSDGTRLCADIIGREYIDGEVQP